MKEMLSKIMTPIESKVVDLKAKSNLTLFLTNLGSKISQCTSVFKITQVLSLKPFTLKELHNAMAM